MNHNIATVIISCSDELHFLDKLLVEAQKFSRYISVSIGTKRWNGDKEDMDKIYAFLLKHEDTPKVRFLLYDPTIEASECEHASLMTKKEMLPEAYARHIGVESLPSYNEKFDYILFLDSDEIIEGDKFKRWLDTDVYRSYEAMKFSCYWYWREPTLQAKNYEEDSIVMLKREHCTPPTIFHDYARTWFYDSISGNKDRNIKGVDGEIMIHHYSWCRNKQQMLNKVRAWGHKNDCKNWEQMVENEFSTPFRGTDFVKGLRYISVENIFDISLE